jgi:hypothetical protein
MHNLAIKKYGCKRSHGDWSYQKIYKISDLYMGCSQVGECYCKKEIYRLVRNSFIGTNTNYLDLGIHINNKN